MGISIYPAMVVILVRFIVAVTQAVPNKNRRRPAPIKRRYKMRWNFKARKISNVATLFNGHFIEIKTFYVAQYEKMPCVSFVGDVDVTKCFALIKEKFGHIIINTYQHSYFDHDAQATFFNNTIFVLDGYRMIELSGNYCQLLHSDKDYGWARDLMKQLAELKVIAGPVHTQVVGFARQADLN